MKVYYLNDTSVGHAGSIAANTSVRKAIEGAGHTIIARLLVGDIELDEGAFKAADAVVVHGEGTLHHDNPRGVFLLSVLRRAQKHGKRTALVNALVQAPVNVGSSHGREMGKVFGSLDLLAVREKRSAKEAEALGGKNVLVLVDSCADPEQWEGGEPLCDLPPVTRGFTHPSSRCSTILNGIDYVRFGLHAPFRDIVATLRTSSCYLTGQHHGIYAAALAGIPFVPIPSNSHKVGALLEWSGIPIRIAKTPDQVLDCMKAARQDPRPFARFRRWLLVQERLTSSHFERLG